MTVMSCMTKKQTYSVIQHQLEKNVISASFSFIISAFTTVISTFSTVISAFPTAISANTIRRKCVCIFSSTSLPFYACPHVYLYRLCQIFFLKCIRKKKNTHLLHIKVCILPLLSILLSVSPLPLSHPKSVI